MKCLEEVRVGIDVGAFVFFGKGKMKDVQDVYFLGRIKKQGSSSKSEGESIVEMLESGEG